LLDQLAPGGRMVLPIGPEGIQQLTVIDKADDGRIRTRSVIPVRFGTLETVI
jgi:protein-L-isoaspartate(D-aspartate) O-methyltransferase